MKLTFWLLTLIIAAGVIAFATKYNAGVNKEHLLIGTGLKYSKFSKISISTNILYFSSNKANPFGDSPFYNGMKFESNSGVNLSASIFRKVNKNRIAQV